MSSSWYKQQVKWTVNLIKFPVIRLLQKFITGFFFSNKETNFTLNKLKKRLQLFSPAEIVIVKQEKKNIFMEMTLIVLMVDYIIRERS